VLSDRGLCDGLITRPEESYRLWCVLVRDLETSRRTRLKFLRVVKCLIEEKEAELDLLLVMFPYVYVTQLWSTLSSVSVSPSACT
jgi:hypothetical protein